VGLVDEAMGLHMAAADGDVVMMRTLVEQGADVEAQTAGGLGTPGARGGGEDARGAAGGRRGSGC
jgi:hypothetical protein